MLDGLGLTPSAVTVYRRLISLGQASGALLAESVGLPLAEALVALGELEDLGLVTQTPDADPEYLPARPDIAIDALALRKREALERARLEAKVLTAELRAARGTHDVEDVMQVITGPSAIAMHAARLQDAARSEVLIIDCGPPYLGPAGVLDECLNNAELEGLAKGVAYRVIYQRRALDGADRIATVARYAEAGEQARVLPELPFRMVIADNDAGMVPLELDRHSTAMLVQGALLTILVECFEALWARAVPFSLAAGTGTTLNEQPALGCAERKVLRLMATGAKDEAIARHVGVSVRTLGRYVDRLMSELGASTRFQAGLQAKRRGWV